MWPQYKLGQPDFFVRIESLMETQVSYLREIRDLVDDVRMRRNP